MMDNNDLGRPGGLSQAEKWLSVIGYEGLYEVSSLGRIWSHHGNGRAIALNDTDKDGYPIVHLSKDGKRKTLALHRIVCTAFHGPQPNPIHKEVAHLDGDRTNARAANLKWVGRVQNHSHKLSHGTHQAGEKHPRARLTKSAVDEIRASRGLRAAIAAKYNISKDTVTDIRRGRRWGGTL